MEHLQVGAQLRIEATRTQTAQSPLRELLDVRARLHPHLFSSEGGHASALLRNRSAPSPSVKASATAKANTKHS
jgi:hypothetical protein